MKIYKPNAAHIVRLGLNRVSRYSVTSLLSHFDVLLQRSKRSRPVGASLAMAAGRSAKAVSATLRMMRRLFA
ncbi:hypothetical protein DYH55_06620 [Methylovirgula sp. 4M-Z18]|nr:hypothetical protein DYH55_06620 [Methylovirgula sp. 4M-Z18]